MQLIYYTYISKIINYPFVTVDVGLLLNYCEYLVTCFKMQCHVFICIQFPKMYIAVRHSVCEHYYS